MDLLERLEHQGWRITPQRRAVAVALVGEQVHLTAEEVHVRARAVVPEISLATVYNTLNELAARGEVAEVRVAGGSARYDPNIHRAHHHLVCDGCGLILDVHPDGLGGVELSPDERNGFTLNDVEVVFRGLCTSCV